MARQSNLPVKQQAVARTSLLGTVALYSLSLAVLAGAGYLGYRFVYLPWRSGTLAETWSLEGKADDAAAAPAAATLVAATRVPPAFGSIGAPVPAVLELPVGPTRVAVGLASLLV